MRFEQRKEFLTDPEVFRLADVTTALGIYAEMCEKFSAHPKPKFLEIDRASGNYDDLWHFSLDSNEKFSREIEVPAINSFVKQNWKRTKIGITPARIDQFTIAHNTLKSVDYFPEHGDRVFWQGRRYHVVEIDIPGEAYWGQTNQWMGILITAIVAKEGDSLPAGLDPSTRAPAEVGESTETVPDPMEWPRIEA